MYLPAMEKQLAILDELYEEYNLESDEVVWNSTEARSRAQIRTAAFAGQEGASITCIIHA